MSDPARPAVTVITPAYNAAATIAETIESLRAQSLTDWEQIVCDDGSSDDTVAVVEAAAEPRVRLLRGEHRGQSAAQNRAFGQRRADLVLFLDADDMLAPRALERLAGALAAAPGACAAYGDAVTVGEDGSAYGEPPLPSGVLSPRPSGDVLEVLLGDNFVPSGGILVRAAAFTAAGGFAEDLRIGQDWEMWCRLALQGDFVFLGPGAVLRHRARAGSLSRGAGAEVERHFEAIERVFADPAVAARLTPARLAAPTPSSVPRICGDATSLRRAGTCGGRWPWATGARRWRRWRCARRCAGSRVRHGGSSRSRESRLKSVRRRVMAT